MNKLATELRVPVTRIAESYHERRGITTDTALRGPSPFLAII
jgi:plasmid maintenance system antidote protein VapI